MQNTVFSVEPQSGRTTILSIATVGQNVSVADPATHFKTVFVSPDTSEPEARATDALDAPALAGQPDVQTTLPKRDAAALGLVSKSVTQLGFRAMQGTPEAGSQNAPARTVHHWPATNDEVLNTPSSGTIAGRNSNAAPNPTIADKAAPILRATKTSTTVDPNFPLRTDAGASIPTDGLKHNDMPRPGPIFEGRQAAANPKGPIFRLDNTKSDGFKLARDGQASQNEYLPKSAPVVRDNGWRGSSGQSSAETKNPLESRALPGDESRTSHEPAALNERDLSQNALLGTDNRRPPHASSAQTLASGNSFRLKPVEVAPIPEIPPPLKSAVQALLIDQPEVGSNGAEPRNQFPVGTGTPRLSGGRAANFDRPGPRNLPTDKPDQRAGSSASLIRSAILTEKIEYTVEIANRPADGRPSKSAEHAPRIPVLPVEIRIPHNRPIPAGQIDVPIAPKSAVSDQAATSSSPRRSTEWRRASRQVTARQPASTTSPTAAPTGTPPPTSAPPLLIAAPGDLAGTLFRDGIESIEHTLTIDGADRSFRQARAPALDVLRRLDVGMNRIELARSVATQIGDAARASVDGTIEVRLSPEELGRVRLSMNNSELGLTVTIIAERGETMELIRRNADLFAQDLRSLGHQNIAFAFGQDSERQPFDHAFSEPDIAAEGSATESDGTQQVEPAFLVAENGRLDIRL